MRQRNVLLRKAPTITGIIDVCFSLQSSSVFVLNKHNHIQGSEAQLNNNVTISQQNRQSTIIQLTHAV